MSVLTFQPRAARVRIGLKGPRAAQWLAEQGIALPFEPNTWTASGRAVSTDAAAMAAATAVADAALLVARLGTSEFFIEGGAVSGSGAGSGAGTGGGASGAGCSGASDATVRRIASAVQAGLPGVYPVLREDAAFLLSGEGALDVLAQVCNVNFAALDLSLQPLIMTLLIGVAVLIVPQTADGVVQYRIWCDPTFGSYVDESVGKVVIDCGGSHRGVSA